MTAEVAGRTDVDTEGKGGGSEPRRIRRRLSKFFIALFGLTAIAHIPAALGTTELARRLGASSPWGWGFGLAAIGLMLFAGRARMGSVDRRDHGTIHRAFDIGYFIHWGACALALVPATVGSLLLLLVDAFTSHHVTAHMKFYMVTYGVALLLSAYGTLVRRRWFVVHEEVINVMDLPSAFDGYRIAHLSDLHIGTMSPRAWGERWARATNRRAPDLTVVTGDLVTSGTEFHGDIASVLGMLEARDGVFVSMGNHDYFGNGEPLVSMLNAQGSRVLRNEGLLVERVGARIFLAAIDDTWTRRDDMDKALALRPRGCTTVLLAHDPERFVEAAKRGVDVVLSGHTHGGQIALPFFSRWVSLSHLSHRFHIGFYKLGRSTLYVHPGLGTTGPPLRIGVSPAVVIHTLRASAA